MYGRVRGERVWRRRLTMRNSGVGPEGVREESAARINGWPMPLFFTADTHFGDHRTLNILRRPYASVAHMDNALVAAWNEVVGPGDEVWHLGDFARRAGAVPDLLAQLHGTKHLLRGNIDQPATADAAGWASVQDYAELKVDGTLLVLCHYPFRSWNSQHRGAINLHGHSHGRLKPVARQFDVGVDARGFRPTTLQALLGTSEGVRSKKSIFD